MLIRLLHIIIKTLSNQIVNTDSCKIPAKQTVRYLLNCHTIQQRRHHHIIVCTQETYDSDF